MPTWTRSFHLKVSLSPISLSLAHRSIGSPGELSVARSCIGVLHDMCYHSALICAQMPALWGFMLAGIGSAIASPASKERMRSDPRYRWNVVRGRKERRGAFRLRSQTSAHDSFIPCPSERRSTACVSC